MSEEFLVLKWNWIEELNDSELNDFYFLLSLITAEKPEYDYYVVNKNEPYAHKIKEAIDKGERIKNLPDERIGISKEELIKELKELTESGNTDSEALHAEADELLLNYINDPEIEKVFEEVPRWYA